MYAVDYVQVGSNIQKQLSIKGYTQQNLADKLFISKQVMNKIIKGTKAINIKELAKIASVLEISADELLIVKPEMVENSNISFMGEIEDREILEKVNFIRSIIDDIYLLEEILDD